MPDIRVTPTSARVFTFEEPPFSRSVHNSSLVALSGGGFVRSAAIHVFDTGGSQEFVQVRTFDNSNTSIRSFSDQSQRSIGDEGIAALAGGGFVVAWHRSFIADPLQGDIDGDGSADFVVAVQGDAITGADFYFGP